MKLQKKITTNNQNNKQWNTQQKDLQQTQKAGKVSSKPIIWSNTIPYGKYTGKEAAWVKDNDNSYMLWVLKEGLQEKWGLTEPQEVRKVQAIVNGKGVRYIYLTFIPITNGKPSQWL